MALSIKGQEADELARRLAAVTGESLTEAITIALRERLRRIEARQRPARLQDELMAIGRRCAALPETDARSTDEIIGYDEFGVPR